MIDALYLQFLRNRVGVQIEIAKSQWKNDTRSCDKAQPCRTLYAILPRRLAMPNLSGVEGALFTATDMLSIVLFFARTRIHVRNDESGMWALIGYSILFAACSILCCLYRWLCEMLPPEVRSKIKQVLTTTIYIIVISPFVVALFIAVHRWVASPSEREREQVRQQEIERAKQEWRRQIEAARKADRERVSLGKGENDAVSLDEIPEITEDIGEPDKD